MDKNEMITIGIAFEKLRKGFDPYQVLWVTARNLGLVEIGKPGEVLIYNPIIHEDTVSGYLPGDKVTVIECGWMDKKGNVAMRALVK